MSKLLTGQDFFLYYVINGYNQLAAHATDVTLSYTSETTETTTKDGLKGKTYDYRGKYGYTVSLKGITNFIDIANIGQFQLALMQSVKMPFIFRDANEVQYTGTVLITGVDLDTPNAAMSTFTNNMLGDGDIVPIFYDIPPTPPGSSVSIIDQFGALIASVLAPGTYGVLRFDTIDLHSFNPGTDTEIIPPLIIMQAS